MSIRAVPPSETGGNMFVDNARIAYSTNNPFRRGSSASPVPPPAPPKSPFDEDEASGPSRSVSVRQAPGRRIVSPPVQPVQRVMSQAAYSVSDQSLSDSFGRRQYSTANNGSAVRRSNNPFLEDSFDRRGSQDADESTPFVTERRQPPQRPPSSSKPRLDDHARGRANSDSSVAEMNQPPRLRNRENSDTSGLSSSRRHDKERRSHREHKEHREYRDANGHREHKHRDHANGHGSSSRDKDRRRKEKEARRRGQPLDVIDKLDVTGLFGPGSFHHDGPFDACNPHRNKNSVKGPVAAFPIDGANNSMAEPVGGRTNPRVEDTVLGRGVDEAYLDFNTTAVRGRDSPAPLAFDPALKEQPVHGDPTMGLGTSTFLDGAPASRQAISKSAEEGSASLGRKKSLVQRLRGSSGSGPAPPRPPKPAVTSPSAIDESTDPLERASSNPLAGSPIGAARDSRDSREGRDRKISYDTSSKPARDGNGSGGAGGLLRRVKSLKVGSRRA